MGKSSEKFGKLAKKWPKVRKSSEKWEKLAKVGESGPKW